MITCSKFLKWTHAFLYDTNREWKETKLFADVQQNHLKDTLDEAVRVIDRILSEVRIKMDFTSVGKKRTRNEMMAGAVQKHQTKI